MVALAIVAGCAAPAPVRWSPMPPETPTVPVPVAKPPKVYQQVTLKGYGTNSNVSLLKGPPKGYLLAWDYGATNAGDLFEVHSSPTCTGPFAFWTNVAGRIVPIPVAGQPQRYYIVRVTNTVYGTVSDWNK